MRPGNPGSALVILGSQPLFLLLLSVVGFERFCFLEESLEVLATRALEEVDIAYILKALAKLRDLARECFQRSFPTSGVFDEERKRPGDLVVIACSRFVEHCDHGGVRRAFNIFDTNESGLAPVLDDLLS